ncbi:MAG: FAD:protein FMN transferase, partial [Acidobacteriota bacterium]
MLRWLRTTLVLLLAAAALPRAAGTAHDARPIDDGSIAGVPLAITAVHGDDARAVLAVAAARAEVERLAGRLFDTGAASETARVNRAAGRSEVAASDALIARVARASALAKATDRAYDPAVGGLTALWRFDGARAIAPDSAQRAAAREHADHRRVVVDADRGTIQLPHASMRLDLDGPARGHAADRALAILREAGATGGLVVIGGSPADPGSGSVRSAFGFQEDGSPWTVPLDDPRPPAHVFGRLALREGRGVAILGGATPVRVRGRDHARVVVPRTGWLANDVRRVAVAADDAETAYAYAYALVVLGA